MLPSALGKSSHGKGKDRGIAQILKVVEINTKPKFFANINLIKKYFFMNH